MLESPPRSSFSLLLFSLFEGLILFGCTIRPAWYRPLLFIPIPFITYYFVFHTTTGSVADVGIGSTLVIHLLSAFDYIVLADIQETLYRVGEKPGQIISAPFLQRFAWSFHLHCSPRGVRWAHEVSHIPKNPPSLQNSRAFLLSRSFTACICLGILSVCIVINAANPALVPGAIPLYNQPLYIKLLSALGLGIPVLAHMNFEHCLLGILLVGSGISEPADWPPLFGSLWGMWSLQCFWRRVMSILASVQDVADYLINVWHQSLRKLLLSMANFIIHTVLRFPNPPSNTSLIIGLLKLHFVFLISGLIHAAGEIMMLGYGGSGALYFFMLQGWGITLEMVVRYFVTGSTRASDKPPSVIWRLLGYVWVGCWFIAVMPLMQQPMIEAGLFLSGLSDTGLAQKVGRMLGLDVI